MSKQLNITDFRFGLDSRRSELTSRIGVLMKCENGRITQGAEVHKRKAFVQGVPLPAGCYGIVPTDEGLVTFGSVALPTGMVAWPAYNQFLGASMPPLSYMQFTLPAINTYNTTIGSVQLGLSRETQGIFLLSYPPSPNFPASFGIGSSFTVSGYTSSGTTFLNGTWTCANLFAAGHVLNVGFNILSGIDTIIQPGIFTYTYAVTNPQVTGFVSGGTFNDFPFVALTFSDNTVKVFYGATQTNGQWQASTAQLVGDFTSGIVTSTNTIDIATAISALINNNPAFTSTVNGSNVTIVSVNSADTTKQTPGDNISISNTLDLLPTSTGTLTLLSEFDSVPGIVATAATAEFYIWGGITGGVISNIYVNDNGGGISTTQVLDLLNYPVPWDQSSAITAADVAVAINANSNTTNCTALASGNKITISGPVNKGTQFNEATVGIYCSGICTDNCQLILSGSGLTVASIVPTVYNKDLLDPTTKGANPQAQTSTQTIQQFIDNTLVPAINTNSVTTGYCAGSDDVDYPGILFISRIVTGVATLTSTVAVTWSVQPGKSGGVGETVNTSNYYATVSRTSLVIVLYQPIGSVTATPVNGIGPFTYLWEQVGTTNTAGLIIAQSPKARTTAFVGGLVSKLPSFSSSFVCNITDTGNGNLIASTPVVTVSWRN